MSDHAVGIPDLDRFRTWIAARDGDFTAAVPPADARLVDDLGYDSLALFELLLSIEESFDVQVGEEHIGPETTVVDLHRLIA